MEDEEMGHPDAAQDERMIAEWCKRELLPIFKQIKEEIDHIKQVQEAIVGGFGEAVSGHRRSSLMDSIDLSDLGEVGDTYRDLEGSDLKEDLINHIMDSDIPDDQIEDILATLKENARAKYGKYKRAEPEAPEGMGDDGDGVLGEPEPEEAAPEEESKKKKPADEWYERVMAQHKSKSGLKL